MKRIIEFSKNKLLIGDFNELKKLKPDLDAIRVNIWWSELGKLKPVFDKIRAKSYEEATKYWEEKIFPLSVSYPIELLRIRLPITFDFSEMAIHSNIFRIDEGRNIRGSEISNEELIKDKNILTITPVNEEELEKFNYWYFTYYANSHFNIEKERNIIRETLDVSPDKKKYIVREIEKLENQNEKNKSARLTYRNNLNKKLEDILLRGKFPDWKKTCIEEIIHFSKMKFELERLVFLKEKLSELENGKIDQTRKRLKWNCSPSIMGFIMTELAKNGFIEYPLRAGEPNYTGLSKICLEIFDVDTTPENLAKEFNPNKNTLSDTKRAKFTLPELKDLS